MTESDDDFVSQSFPEFLIYNVLSESFKFSIHKIILCMSDNFTDFCKMNFECFLTFSYLIALARISSILLNKVFKVSTPV